MVTLYELLRVTNYNQVFYCYVVNAFDQNVLIGSGVREQLMDDGACDVFWHLMDKVDRVRIGTDGSIIVQTNDENFEKRVEELYPEDIVKKWSKEKGNMPYKYSSEIFH